MKQLTNSLLALFSVAGLAAITSACAPVPVVDSGATHEINLAAARSVTQRNACMRCHGVTKEKIGPTYSAIASSYRGNPDAENILYQHLISGEGGKCFDRVTDEHRIPLTKNPEAIRNVVRWVLAQ